MAPARVTGDADVVAGMLRAGAIAVYPTETFYGLGALARDPAALARLAAAKLRPEGKPLPLVAADRATAFGAWSVVPDAAPVLADAFWPGPLTLVAAAARELPREVAPEGTAGVRVPGSAVARELCRLAGGLLVSTSANLAGGPAPTRLADLDPALLDRVDVVLDGGPTPGGLPSAVVDLSGALLHLVRPGAVPWESIRGAIARAGLPSPKG